MLEKNCPMPSRNEVMSADGSGAATMPEEAIPATVGPVITDPDVEAYAERHTTRAHHHLVAIDGETRDTLPTPQMLTGHIESRLLDTLVWATGSERVLLVGTFTLDGA